MINESENTHLTSLIKIVLIASYLILINMYNIQGLARGQLDF